MNAGILYSGGYMPGAMLLSKRLSKQTGMPEVSWVVFDTATTAALRTIFGESFGLRLGNRASYTKYFGRHR